MNTPAVPATGLIELALLFTLCNLALAWFRPFKTCRRCRGYGKVARRSGIGRPKPCRRCHALGIRLRLSRRVLNVARAHFHSADVRQVDRPAPVVIVDRGTGLARAHREHVAAIVDRLDVNDTFRAIVAPYDDKAA